ETPSLTVWPLALLLLFFVFPTASDRFSGIEKVLLIDYSSQQRNVRRMTHFFGSHASSRLVSLASKITTRRLRPRLYRGQTQPLLSPASVHCIDTLVPVCCRLCAVLKARSLTTREQP